MLRVHRGEGGGWRTTTGLEAARAAAAGLARHPAWFEAVVPDTAEQAFLLEQLHLPKDSLEDSLQPHHPPLLRELEGHLMAIVHAPEPGLEVHTRKISLFLGRGWLVSVVRRELPLLDPLRPTLERNPDYYLGKPERILHAILHHLCDVFEERVDEMIDCAEELEERSLERAATDTLEKLQQLRRRTAALARVVRAQRDVMQALARGGNPLIPRAEEPYLRDVADHMLRIYDLLEAVRDGILAARDAHLTAMNTELNVTMRTLTAVATLLLPLSLLAGLFGMNFRAMPLIDRPWGVWALLGLMALVGGCTWRWLRGRRWL
ncbi:MAG: magnesium transporter CorA family protein [Planctomycetes bacterium]|nr:magnesium transporter CorA family protein [Planctomycetota bacterium]